MTVTHDGKTDNVTTTYSTVSDVLGQLNIPVGPADQVSVSLASAPAANQNIVLKRVSTKTVVETQAIPFATHLDERRHPDQGPDRRQRQGQER